MRYINFTYEILDALAKCLPEFEVIEPDPEANGYGPDRSFFGMASLTLDGRFLLSFFCLSGDGDRIQMCPIGTVVRFYVNQKGWVVKAVPEQFQLCLVNFYGSFVSIDVFASLPEDQSRSFGPLGLQQAGEILYKQYLRDQWYNFSSYYGMMALSNVCMEWDGEPPFGN